MEDYQDKMKAAKEKQKRLIWDDYIVRKLTIKKVAGRFDQEEEWVRDKLLEYEIPIRVQGRPLGVANKPKLFKGIDYKMMKVDGRWIPEHRYIWEQAHGPLPKGWVVHHLNGIKSDNSPENLLGTPRTKHKTAFILEATLKRIQDLEGKVKQQELDMNEYEHYISELLAAKTQNNEN